MGKQRDGKERNGWTNVQSCVVIGSSKRVVVEWANTSEFAKRVGKGVAV